MQRELPFDFDAMERHCTRGGTLEWIGVRSAKHGIVEALDSVEAIAGRGLLGDHRALRAGGKREVTLIQAEHLQAVAAALGIEKIDPARVRRNLVASGIDLLALHGREFQIADVVLIATGPCAPCSRMEAALGAGGQRAMKGRGGITARIVRSGVLKRGDDIFV